MKRRVAAVDRNAIVWMREIENDWQKCKAGWGWIPRLAFFVVFNIELFGDTVTPENWPNAIDRCGSLEHMALGQKTPVTFLRIHPKRRRYYTGIPSCCFAQKICGLPWVYFQNIGANLLACLISPMPKGRGFTAVSLNRMMLPSYAHIFFSIQESSPFEWNPSNLHIILP